MKVLVFKDIKNNRWTIWSIDRKKHIGYRKTLSLKNCELIVIESKRQQVLKSKKRFPHAWIIGTITKISKQNHEITYNPFKNKSFMRGKKSVKKISQLFFNSSGKVFA